MTRLCRLPRLGARVLPVAIACALGLAMAPASGQGNRKSGARRPAAKNAVSPGIAPVRAALPPAWSVAFSPDNSRIAVGGYRSVTLWSVADGKRIARWDVGQDAVRTMAFSPDGSLLAVGGGAPGADGSLVLLDTRSGSPVRSITAHEDTVEAVAFAGNHLISAGDDERVVITDFRTGAKVGTLTEHIGRCLAVAVPWRTTEGSGGAIFATGGADKMVKIWDADLRRVVVNFDQSGGPVWGLSPMPQPGRFVAASGDGIVRLFQVRADKPGATDAEDGNPAGKPESTLEIRSVVRPGEPSPRTGNLVRAQGGHTGPVYAVAVSRNGNYVATGGADRKVIVWNGNLDRLRDHAEATSDIWNLTISPDSRWLATASRDGRARLYDLSDGKMVREYPPAPTGAKP